MLPDCLACLFKALSLRLRCDTLKRSVRTALGVQAVVPSGKLTRRTDDDPMLKPGERSRMELIHDEHIIYDTAQQHPRYLIEVEFKRR